MAHCRWLSAHRTACLLTTLLALLLPFAAAADWYHEEQAIMGTSVSVTLWADSPVTGKQAIAAVMDEMRRVDSTLSSYKPQSDLSYINQHAWDHPVTITPEMVRLLDKSLWYSRLSDGAFDISFASVGQQYDYRTGKQPSDAERKVLQRAIDYRLITLDQQSGTVALGHPDMRIGLGGIAKGYAVDRAIAQLQALGVAHANVSAGGDSRILGDKLGEPWLVGIRNPRAADPEKSVAIVIPLADAAISTSGDYERFFFDPDTEERVHHIINPKTGRSASGVTSVSIIGPDGFDTDPLSTTVFIMGVTEGLALIERLADFECVIIDAAGEVHYSTGLQTPAAVASAQP
ncbi:MAG: FAD:protein FMN transferase [Pseudomonadales bacterium]|nr:FAD:protein FMN transferase [Pseudomonadales bacterium]